MQKLKDLYRQTQRNASADFDKVTIERVKKIHAFANKECDSILANQKDFTNLQEVIFIRDKFKKLVDLFNDSITQGYKKSKIQTEAKIILQDNYVAGTNPSSNVQPRLSNTKDNVVNPPSPLKKTGSNNIDIKMTDSRNVINSFFESKKTEVQQSKLGFKSIIEGQPQPSKKFPVRAQAINSEDIRRLQLQIKRLKKETEEKDFNRGLYQIKALQYQERINELAKEVQHLQQENKFIKEQSQKSENLNIPDFEQIAPEEEESTVYGPYKIKYKHNDMTKINRVGHAQPRPQIQTLQSEAPDHKSERNLQRSRRHSQNLDIINQLEDIEDNPKDNSFRTEPRMKYDREEMQNDINNSVVRNKISFFRPSMVIYRGEDCDVAIKSLELVNFQKRKIIIYINNKSGTDCKANISYKYNQDYYSLAVQHKLLGMEAGKQGREQIEVLLNNHQDMDSLIEAKLTIDLTEIDFLVPALFIQFVEKRPLLQKHNDYQIYTARTIYQFSTIEAAEELIPFDKEYGYGEKLDTARAYAVSRRHEGYVFLRWPKQGVIELETIKPWKLLLSFLLGKDF